jgi:hypothetical protein
MSKGFVYIVRNPAFMHVFKIGYTKKDSVEERGLNSSNVPEDFEVLYSFECDDPKEKEDILHRTFESHRHYTETGRKTEFFYTNCLKKVLDLLKTFGKMKGIDLEKDSESEYDETKNIENLVKRKGKLPLIAYAPVGSELVFTKDESVRCKIINEWQVEYEGKTYSLSELAGYLLKKDWGYKSYVRGTAFFMYKGKKLTEIRDEIWEADE